MTTLDPGGATWQVFLSEQFGFCRSDPAEIAEELADSDSDYTTINLVRGSALPTDRDGGLRLPGTWSSRDLYELSLDDYETPQERAEAWKLAQAAAWGMSNPDASEEVLRLRSDYEARGSVIESLKREVTEVSLVARRTMDENDRLKAELAEEKRTGANAVAMLAEAVKEVDRLKTAHDRLRPVVEAAKALVERMKSAVGWSHSSAQQWLDPDSYALFAAVDALGTDAADAAGTGEQDVAQVRHRIDDLLCTAQRHLGSATDPDTPDTHFRCHLTIGARSAQAAYGLIELAKVLSPADCVAVAAGMAELLVDGEVLVSWLGEELNREPAASPAGSSTADEEDGRSWSEISASNQETWRYSASTAIDAALPELRKAIAEELRTEHRNLRGVPLWVNGFEHGIEEAERVVRGQSGGGE